MDDDAELELEIQRELEEEKLNANLQQKALAEVNQSIFTTYV